MRVVIQRVTQASVAVEGRNVAAIGPGYVVLVGVAHTDGLAQADWLAQKVAGLRLFEDAQGLTNRSLADVGGDVLVISQFTLYADARKGRRPSFSAAAPPAHAEPLVERFIHTLRSSGIHVATGVFRAYMQVALINDGPMTILLESEAAGE